MALGYCTNPAMQGRPAIGPPAKGVEQMGPLWGVSSPSGEIVYACGLHMGVMASTQEECVNTMKEHMHGKRRRVPRGAPPRLGQTSLQGGWEAPRGVLWGRGHSLRSVGGPRGHPSAEGESPRDQASVVTECDAMHDLQPGQFQQGRAPDERVGAIPRPPMRLRTTCRG